MIFRRRRRSSPGPDGAPGSSRSGGPDGVAASPETWLVAPGGAPPGTGGREPAGAPVRLEVVSRAGCHLCERTAERLAPVAQRYGASLVLLDVDAVPALAHHSEHVPVVRVDGVEVDRLMVDVARVERALAGR